MRRYAPVRTFMSSHPVQRSIVIVPSPHNRLFPFPSMSLEYQITLARLRERERRPRLG
jgi:hypothetical protein